MKSSVYSPFVKTKRGEARALKELDINIKKGIFPFFDVLALKQGVLENADVQTHLDKQVRMIELAWGGQDGCYVDLFDVNPNARVMNGVHPLIFVTELLNQKRIPFVPVAGLGRDTNYLMALRNVVRQDSPGIALRIEVEDLLLPIGLNLRIQNLIDQIGANSIPLHIIVDCRSLVNQDISRLTRAIHTALPLLRSMNPECLMLCASSMVPDMSTFKKNSINRVKRDDLALWMNFVETGNTDLSFGDYGVIHPDYVDLDPRFIKPAAKIRYTVNDDWIVIKGFRWVDDTSQHHELSMKLASCSEFRGVDSWGGEYIQSAAVGRLKYGALETWVTIDQNAHITLTAKQIKQAITRVHQKVSSLEVTS